MKLTYYILGFVAILSLVGFGIIIVQAQSPQGAVADFGIRISPRCFATNISIDIVANNHTTEGYSNYEATLNAGRCTRIISRSINETRSNNLLGAINSDLNQTLNNTGFAFYPDRYSTQGGLTRTSYSYS